MLNLNLKITTSKIEGSNDEIKEFEMHIGELLKLGVIRKSTSPHRRAAFIVRKQWIESWFAPWFDFKSIGWGREIGKKLNLIF